MRMKKRSAATILVSSLVGLLAGAGQVFYISFFPACVLGTVLAALFFAWGGWLPAALYLAALTTLAAALRGLRALLCRGYPAGVAALAALSLGGLERLVARVYPLLGAGCLVLLALAMWQNRTKP